VLHCITFIWFIILQYIKVCFMYLLTDGQCHWFQRRQMSLRCFTRTTLHPLRTTPQQDEGRKDQIVDSLLWDSSG